MTATITTPTIRRGLRRSMFWILASVFVLVIAVIALVLQGGANPDGTPLSPNAAGPAGSKAIAEVLKRQGVDVIVPDAYRAAEAALDDQGDTLLIVDQSGYLESSRLRTLAASASHLVLIDPTFDALKILAPGVAHAGRVGAKALTADCSLRAVDQAGAVTGTGKGYRAAATATRCLGSGSGVYSVVQLTVGSRLVTVVGTTAAFSNEHVKERGNAALALGILGAEERLVWYLPTIADAGLGDDGKSIAELTPPWVTTVMLLLLLVVVAAAIWRGRRMGPLVVENLPVTVRASETMEGRARLYQKAASRLRALDSLRVGTVDRLAKRCGLSRLATVEEVIGTVAGVTGRDPAAVRLLLLEAVPRTDRELVRLSDELLDLERATARALDL